MARRLAQFLVPVALALVMGLVASPAAEALSVTGSTAVAGPPNLQAVACAGSSCYAAGASNGVGAIVPISANGAPGAVQTVSGTTILYDIACPSSGFCVAVGTAGSELNPIGVVVPIRNGAPGSIQTVSGTAALAGVACVNSSACVAVGSKALPFSTQEGVAVAVTSGAPGQVLDLANTWTMNGVTCNSSGGCVAVGTEPTYRAFAGADVSFSLGSSGGFVQGGFGPINQVTDPSGYFNHVVNLTAVACQGAVCTAVGSGIHSSGNTFFPPEALKVTLSSAGATLQGGPDNLYEVGRGASQFWGVSCPTSSLCVAIGSGAAGGFVQPILNGKFEPVTSVANTSFGAGADVVCTSSTSCLGVGDGVAFTINPSTPISTSLTVEDANGQQSYPLNQRFTLTALLTPMPDGGTISFSSGSTPISGCQGLALDDSSFGYAGEAAATCTMSFPVGGVYSINATYSGDSNFAASSAATYDQTITAPQPVVTGILATSNCCPDAGGTSIQVYGSGFTGATAVDFGTTAAASFTVVNDGFLTATSPAGNGSVHVTVTTFGGTSATSSADLFNYAAAPAATTVTVNGAGPYGGTFTLSATLTSNGKAVSGKTISFSLNGVAACGGSTGVSCPVTNSGGVASLSNVRLPGVAAGSYASGVGANFTGDTSYAASSGSGTLTVTPAQTTTTAQATSATYDASATLAATVTSQTGIAVNEGSVTFTVSQGGTTVGTASASVSNGAASASFPLGPSVRGGQYAIAASYHDGATPANFADSAGTPASLVVNNPTPVLTSLGQNSAVAGSSALTLALTGSGFTPDSIAQWNGAALPTTFSSPTTLQATLPASDLASAGANAVSVTNPAPGGGASAPQLFLVTSTAATVTASNIGTASGGTANASLSAANGAPAVSATATGRGSVAVAQYQSDPASAATFDLGGGGYVDVSLLPGSTFTSLQIRLCQTSGATVAYWYNGSSWQVVSQQSYNATTGCLTITVTSTSSPSLTQLNGTVLAAGAPPTLTLPPVTAPYGGTATLSATLRSGGNPVSGKTVSFRLNGSTVCGGSSQPACPITNSGGVATIGNVSLAGSHAGSYPGGISASFAGDTNFAATSGTGALTITPAPLTITADDASREHGAANPSFSVTYHGFVNGDDPSKLGGSPTFSTTAARSSPVGRYTVTPSGLTSSDYAITFAPGVLTITPARTSTGVSSATATYGAASVTLAATLASDTGIVVKEGAVTFTVSQGSATVGSVTASVNDNAASAGFPLTGYGGFNLDAGGYRVSASYTDGASPANFQGSAASTAATLTIGKAAITVSANDASMVYGATLPALTGTLTGVVSPDGITASYATSATSSSSAGSYAIVPSLADPNQRLGNYTVTSTNGTLTITPAHTATSVASLALVYGAASATLTATVSNPDSPAVVNEGTVTFTLTSSTGSQAAQQSVSVTNGRASASLSLAGLPAGTYTLNAAYTDGASPANFQASSGSGSLALLYHFGGFLPPLQASGNTAKAGRALPVKFVLTDADGHPISTAQATLLVNGQPATSKGASTSGNRIAVDGEQYHFNLDTRGLTGTVTLTVSLDDGTTHSVSVMFR